MEEKNSRQEYIENHCVRYPEKAKILQHFGYDPIVYGMINSTATWCKERLFQEIPYVKTMSEFFKGRKLRIVIDYDPEYPRTLCRVEQIPTSEEADNKIEPVPEKELELTEILRR